MLLPDLKICLVLHSGDLYDHEVLQFLQPRTGCEGKSTRNKDILTRRITMIVDIVLES